MGDVLTQSQIDALLKAAAQGGDNTASEKQEKKYRKYDFYSPKKFTKDKLKIINGVYESYARLVSSRLNGLLRVNSEVSVVTVEEQRYYEFSNALVDSDVLTLINVEVEQNPDDMPVVMHITPQLMLSMIDRMLGGPGDDVNIPVSYTYTDIELSLYEIIIKYIIGSMKDGWANYLEEIGFTLSKIETNPSLMQVIGMDETIVIIVLDVSINSVRGKINICIPGNLLSNIFVIFDKRTTSSSKSSHEEKSTDEIMGSIKNSVLEIKAELGETQILLNDVYNLQVGDVINLNKPKDSDVYLYIEDKAWFKGKLGVQNKNMAVKISGVCEDL